MRLVSKFRLAPSALRCRNFATTQPLRGERFLDQHGNPDYLRMILLSRVYGACDETPCDPAIRLSAKTGANVRFKREDLQPVFSFKLRGAYNMIAQLTNEEKAKGVISASAGNHAQGVAYSAGRLGIPATIVMPKTTPAIKYENVARLGASVILYGDDFDSARAECARLEKERGMTYIPPFDDPFVIAGQGTIAMEICRQLDVTNLKAVFCAVGGGGLIAGIAVYLKRVAPHVKVIGVETYDADAMYRSLKEGKRVLLPEVGVFADGAAVKEVGVEPFRLAQKYVDEVIHVNTDEICAAINDVFDDTRSVMEPAGAMSTAGLRKWLAKNPQAIAEAGPDGEFCSVISGANMNFDRLRFVSERSRLGAGKEVFFIVEMPERSGSFKRLVDILLPREITEFSYRFNRSNPDARVYISFSVNNRDEIEGLTQKISEAGMKAYDLSDNALAKSHARYLVGGTPHLSDERVFRFEFPERPGALDRFLSSMQTEWNVSLFHYRNNGSDIGRILTGIQIPAGKESEVQDFLNTLGYRYYEEDSNLAYQLCLK